MLSPFGVYFLLETIVTMSGIRPCNRKPFPLMKIACLILLLDLNGKPLWRIRFIKGLPGELLIELKILLHGLTLCIKQLVWGMDKIAATFC